MLARDTPGVLLVDGLPGHAQLLGDLGPPQTCLQGGLYLGQLQGVGQAPQGSYGPQPSLGISGIGRDGGNSNGVHKSNVS